MSECRANADLSGADLREYDLAGRRLTGANLRDTRLAGACLASADLTGVVGLTTEQLAVTDLSRAKLPDDVALQSDLTLINDSIRQSRNLFVALLTACTLCLMALAESTDAQLLADNGRSSLPLIGASVSTKGFFWGAPFLVASVFVYFQLYLQQTWARLAAAPLRMTNGQRLSEAVIPWLPVTLALRHREARSFALKSTKPDRRLWLTRQIVDVLLYLVAPMTVLTCWGNGVAVHDIAMTSFHAIVVAFMIGFSSERYWHRFETLNTGPGLAADRPRATTANWLFMGNCAATFVLIVYSYLPMQQLNVGRLRAFYHPYVHSPGENLSARSGHSSEVMLTQRGLRGAYLAEANLSNVRIVASEIVSADLTRAKLNDALILGAARYYSPQSPNLGVDNSMIIDSTFLDAELDRVGIRNTHLERVDFRRASLRSADIRWSEFLSEVNFGEADLSNARFENVQLQGPNFSHATLDLATFSGATLLNVQFRHATARCIEFDKRSKLKHVTFRAADLRGASFAGVALHTVSFRHTDLRGANFEGATFVNVNFRGAKIDGINFRGVKLEQTTLPEPRHGGKNDDPIDCEGLRRPMIVAGLSPDPTGEARGPATSPN